MYALRRNWTPSSSVVILEPLRRRQPGRKPRRGRPYHHGNLPSALLDAAVALLEADGTKALSLRAVARRAGVSHAAPAHHFGDRNGLLAAVASHGLGRLAEALRRAGLRQADPARVLRSAGAAYLRFATRRKGLFSAVFRSRWAEVDKDALPPPAEALVPLVGACQRAGFLKRGSPRSAALAIWAALHGLAVLTVEGQLPRALGERRRLADEVLQTLFGDLGKAGAAVVHRGPCVYLLRCRGGSLYAGATKDLKRRMEQHRSGAGAKYTRSRLPVTLVWSEKAPSWSAALRLEWRIKRLPRAAKLRLIRSRAPFARMESSGSRRVPARRGRPNRPERSPRRKRSSTRRPSRP